MRWTPLQIFLSGVLGVWFDPSDLSTLFQDAAGTIPVTADGDPVGLMLDKSGNGYHASQSVSGARPVYRTDGVLHWIQLDGINDFLETSAIYFAGTNNMTVSTGIRKVSDAVSGVVVELSESSDVNNGTFIMLAPGGSGTSKLDYRSRGSHRSIAKIESGFEAPVSVVVTGISSIPERLCILRANGSQVDRVTTDQGTGDYGNYPVYIGARSGAVAPFNGKLYSLLILGAQKNTTDLNSLEQYTAGKTGVTL